NTLSQLRDLVELKDQLEDIQKRMEDEIQAGIPPKPRDQLWSELRMVLPSRGCASCFFFQVFWSWTTVVVRPVRLLCSLRTVMTCPPCLGVDHLREVLSDHACSNCSVLPKAVRLARLSSVEQAADWAVSVQQDPLLLGQAVALPKRSAADVPLAFGRRAKRRRPLGLTTRVDQLSTELAKMKTVLQSLRADGGRSETSPPKQGGSSNCEDDAILVVASGSLFREDLPELGPRTSGLGSSASQGVAGEPVSAAIRTALGRLQLEVPPAQSAPSSAFFRRSDAEANFVVPPSAEYVQELHACWADTKAFSHLTADGRALAAMHEAPKFGLGCMAPVVSANASLIVPPDEVLRPNARCPQPQYRVTDDLHCRAYNSGARMGRFGNSLSHPILGLSSSLESVPLDQSTQGLLDTSLQAFALMTLELRRTLSTLVHARRQVWLCNHP
ncbi:hypothetical protein ILYODFUR_011540, partial [Ilyodon furcidens]